VTTEEFFAMVARFQRGLGILLALFAFGFLAVLAIG
jgi:hypothetical protein